MIFWYIGIGLEVALFVVAILALIFGGPEL